MMEITKELIEWQEPEEEDGESEWGCIETDRFRIVFIKEYARPVVWSVMIINKAMHDDETGRYFGEPKLHRCLVALSVDEALNRLNWWLKDNERLVKALNK